MPIYTYVCGSCGHAFEKNTRIADRKEPEKEPCPSCHELKVQHTISGTMVVAGVGTIFSKTPDGFRDILKNIKSQNRNSTIQV